MKGRDNGPWRAFRDRLLERGYRGLWTIPGGDVGMSFDLVCMTTERGTTIFQVWAEGFEVYTTGAPNKIEELAEFLTVREG